MKHSTLEIHSNHLSGDLSGSREFDDRISSLLLLVTLYGEREILQKM
jgi:hypothetical protein